MSNRRANNICATVLIGLALGGVVISPAAAAVTAPVEAHAVTSAQSNSNFTYSDNWLVNDSDRTVHVKAEVDVSYNHEVTDSTISQERQIKSKTVQQDLRPGDTLRLAGASGDDDLFEYHLYVTYADGASADVAMYNPTWGKPWTRDGHTADDKHYIDEGDSHTNYVGNGHTIEVDRHWNHPAGEDDADSNFAFPGASDPGVTPASSPANAVLSANICNWDYHIR